MDGTRHGRIFSALASVGLLVAAVAFLPGCDKAKEFRPDINKVALGMSTHAVVTAIGEPQVKTSDASHRITGFEYWNHGAKKHAEATQMLELFFDSEALCGWLVVEADPDGKAMTDGEGRNWAVVVGDGYQALPDGSRGYLK